MLKEQDIEIISRKIGFDINTYLQKVYRFVSTDISIIFDFYTGNSKDISTQKEILDRLLLETSSLIDILETNKAQLDSLREIEFISLVEDIETQLLFVKNAPKWVRSSYSNTNSPTSSIIYQDSLSQEQTIESLLQEYGYNNTDDEWAEVSILNELEEEQYTPDGGVTLQIPTPNNITSNNIASVVDVITPDTILGRDLHRKLIFVDNDLQSLSQEETFRQSLEILTGLEVGDNPEFPTQGINKKLIVGGNLNTLNLPIILRQLSSLFNSDDTISRFEVSEVYTTRDSLNIKVLVTSIKNTTEEVVV